MNKKNIGIFALMLVILTGIGVASAFPFGKGMMHEDLSEEELTEMQEQHEAMRTAIENEDYKAWKEIMDLEISRMQAEINEENFNSLVERHKEMENFRLVMEEARESGDYTEVAELMAENHEGFGRGMHDPGKGMMGQRFGGGGCPFNQ